MHSKFTVINIMLTALSIVFGGLLVMSVTNRWAIIDAFALPYLDDFIFSDKFDYFEVFKIYFLSLVNSVKMSLLDSSISIFGYDVSMPFIVILGVISVVSIIYMLYFDKSKAAYIPVLCSFISGLAYASIQPDVTVADIGKSLLSKNNVVTAKFNYLDLLRNESYADLSIQLKKVEREFESGLINEFEYLNEYKSFEKATESDLMYFDKWLSETNNRYSVLIARAVLYEELGWNARGVKFSRNTSEDEFSEMRKFFSKAVKDHKAVLELKKRSLVSYGSLINIEPAYDVGMEGNVLFENGIKFFPSSYYLANRYMYKHRPRWGGSYLEIRRAARKMRKQATKNPMLIELGNKELRYRVDVFESDNEIKSAARLRKFSLFYGATIQQIINQEVYFNNKNDSVNAIIALTQGLKLYPNNVKLLVNRAKHYAISDNYEMAISDMVTINNEDIIDTLTCDAAAEVYSNLEQPRKTFQFYTRSIAIDPDRDDFAYNRIYWLSYKKVIPYADALPYLKKWTEVFPESSDGWVSYASTLFEIDEQASVYPYQQFIKYADRNSSIDMNAVKYAEIKLKKINKKN